jgi:tetraacyldisaccharide 4'-kinase
VTTPGSVDRWLRRWWRGDAGAVGAVLDVATIPLEAAFRLAAAARNRSFDRDTPERAPIPVISVGNLVVGGAGKTPFAAWLATELVRGGRRPAIVLRGYGDDEAALHRRWNPSVPVIARRDRAAGVERATGMGCDVAILDDGFQHRRLGRELDIVLVPAESWTLHPRLLPRGAWREPPAALSRAQLAVVTRKSSGEERALTVADQIADLHPGLPIARCALRPLRLVPLHGGDPVTVAGTRVLAVSGVASPEPFLGQLHEIGADAEPFTFPDHHPYAPGDAAALLRRAAGRRVVTTAKDAVKLRALLGTDADVVVLEQEVVIEGGGATLLALLAAATGARC